VDGPAVEDLLDLGTLVACIKALALLFAAVGRAPKKSHKRKRKGKHR
jgi:hypothetical protein